MADNVQTTLGMMQSSLSMPILLGVLGAISLSAQTADEIVNRMNKAEDQRRSDLHHFSATRRYILRNERWNRNAEMTVDVNYRKGDGKRFRILSAQGSPDLKDRVFNRLLEGEGEASRSTNEDPSRITSANYSFRLIGSELMAGRRCYVIELHPKRKEKHLINGKAWIDAEDYGLARMEGRPSANITFWVGKPYIVQNFARMHGQWLASGNHSIAESRLLGKTEMFIQYSNYTVNGRGADFVAMDLHPRTPVAFSFED